MRRGRQPAGGGAAWQVVEDEITDLDRDAAAHHQLANISEEQVATVLRESADPKALLQAVVGRITLDPDTLACQIHYQLPEWLNFPRDR